MAVHAPSKYLRGSPVCRLLEIFIPLKFAICNPEVCFIVEKFCPIRSKISSVGILPDPGQLLPLVDITFPDEISALRSISSVLQ